MPNDQTTEIPALDEARRQLSRFVSSQAHQAADTLGFGWLATAEAPNDFQSLLTAFRESSTTGNALAISNQHCDQTVYSSEAENVHMRFWHDTAHVRSGLTFSASDELLLAQHHLEQAEVAGFTKDSLEYQLLHADTVGQTKCLMRLHRYPDDQLGFAVRTVKYGLGPAIEFEVRRATTSEFEVA